MNNDKELERCRYETRAQRIAGILIQNDGASNIPLPIRAPYIVYERLLNDNLSSGSTVCEIGAGTGEFTGALLRTGATVYATDLSRCSLEIVESRYKLVGLLKTQVADMESLPFQNESFDCVVSAGSLSYGDHDLVLHEIFRVLKRGGVFICVDSLNHNPIYRFNRWLHFLRKNRTRSTLLRMPTLALIDRYANQFASVEVEYFGAVSWLMPLIGRAFGEETAARISNWVDRMVRVRRSAFKFVMVARKVNG
jgi:ubiquinone/menaquinone biosynthesis C-methylase UbiE